MAEKRRRRTNDINPNVGFYIYFLMVEKRQGKTKVSSKTSMFICFLMKEKK